MDKPLSILDHYNDFDFQSDCNGKPVENLGQRRHIWFDLYLTVIILAALLGAGSRRASIEAGY